MSDATSNRSDAIEDVWKPSDVDHHLDLCLTALEAGNVTEASQYAVLAVGRSPLDPHAHHCLGLCHIAAERNYAAVISLERAVTLDSANSQYWSALARAFRACTELVPAERCYETAAAIRPSAMTYISLAGTQIDLGKLEAASSSLRRAAAFKLDEVERLLVNGYTTQLAGAAGPH